MSRSATAYINLDHLCHNYRLLRQRAGKARLIAVVKANAYGHGLDLVTPALQAEGCNHFAVTDASEGATLREILGSNAEIVLLSGIFDRSDAGLAVEHRLTPVIAESWQLQILAKEGFSRDVWMKADTGMGRLDTRDLSSLMTESRNMGIHPIGVMSHLACADTPDHPLNRIQVERMERLSIMLPPNTALSLLNSAGISIMPEHCFDVVRPGIALYGAEPTPARPLGLKPVMQLTCGVIQVRSIPAGTTISYGATYTAKTDKRIAIVSLGYADGLHRLLSNRGHAIYKGMALPVLGRICMDYCILDAGDAPLTHGDEVTFWGEAPLATHVADQAETIAYELFTGVAPRVRRLPVRS